MVDIHSAGTPVPVVIVNYNTGPLLAACLESLLASDVDLDIVVVDNASSDASLASIRDLARAGHRLRIIENPTNVGFAAAVNRATARVSGESLVLLNPDCIVKPHSVRRLLEALEHEPAAGVAGGLVFNFDGTEQRGCRRREPTLARSMRETLPWLRFFAGFESLQPVDMRAEPLPDRPLPVDAVSGSFLVVRRALLDALGGLDAGYFLHCEDLDLCRGARDRGHQVLFVPGAAVFHRQGGSSAGQGFAVERHKHDGMLRYFNKHDGPSAPWAMRAFVRTAVRAHQVLVALRLGLCRVLPRRSADAAVNAIDGRQHARIPVTQVLVVGATSRVGAALIEKLRHAGHEVLAVSRSRPVAHDGPGFRSYRLEYLHKAPSVDVGPVSTLIHLAPIWTLPELLPGLLRFGIRRIVAVSSTSAIAKRLSPDPSERATAQALREGESAVLEFAGQHALSATVVRPTLIYGGNGGDALSIIARFVRRFGFLPLVGDGHGLRQPIHVDDLAGACVDVIDSPATHGKIYELGGGTVLGYRRMVEELCAGGGRRARFVRLPAGLARTLLSVMATVSAKLSARHRLSPMMAERMSADLCYSNAAAMHDFGFRPRAFAP